MKCPKCGKEYEKNKNEWLSCKECGYTEKNLVGNYLSIIGTIIIVGGILISLILPSILFNSFNLIFTIFSSFVFTIMGFIFIGMSEIILLNQKIYSILKK